MKQLLAILFLFVFKFTFAQITLGTYYSGGYNSSGQQFVFLPDNYFQFIKGKDTIGGYAFKTKQGPVSIKYQLDTSTNPKEISINFISESNSKITKSMLGIYKQINTYSYDMVFDEKIRPTKFPEDPKEITHLSRKCDENYLNLLYLTARNQIKGFTPETRVIAVDKENKYDEVFYYQNGKPINTKLFPTKIKRDFNMDGKISQQSLYDFNNNLYKGDLGFCIKKLSYTPLGQPLLVEYYKNEKELITYIGKEIPQTKYVYKDSLLIEINHLINNDSLKASTISKVKLFYDSYGDEGYYEYYYADGKLKEDTLKTKAVLGLTNWINTHAIYPQTFEPILYGNVLLSSTKVGNEKEPQSEKYKLYCEFYLNDTTNTKRKITAYFELDYTYTLETVGYKKEKFSDSWSTGDYDDWMKTFCKPLTGEELKQKELKDKEQIEKTLNILDEALKGTNPGVTISGDMDKKTLRETRRALKKAAKGK